MDKPICVGFAILELSKLHMYEAYYDNLQPDFGQENIHCLYVDTDAFVLSLYTEKLIVGLKILEDIFASKNKKNQHYQFLMTKKLYK